MEKNSSVVNEIMRVRYVLIEAVSERDRLRTAIEKIDRTGRTTEFIEQRTAELKEASEQERWSIAADYAAAVDAVIEALEQKHEAGFSVSSPELQASLSVIQATGGFLEPELASNLVSALSTQPELKVARATMKKAGFDKFAIAAVEQRIYDYHAAWLREKEYGKTLIRNAQSVFGLAERLSKLAALENVEFDWRSIEPSGEVEAFKRGAGLT